MKNRYLPLVALFAALAGCGGPRGHTAAISPEELKAEQLRQQQLVIMGDFREQQRLENVGFALLKNAVPICGPGHSGTRAGFRVANLAVFSKDYQPAARAMGFGDTLTVVTVAKGSAAERQGLRIGDRIATVDNAPTPVGKTAIREFEVQMNRVLNLDRGIPVTVRHGMLALSAMPVAQAGAPAPVDSASAVEPMTIATDTLCNFSFGVVRDAEVNAYADGENVFVTSAMMRFAATDDDLAVVVSHEIAHNALDHMRTKKKNARWGAIIGAAVDLAAASQGMDTQGSFSSGGAAIGAQVFSQDFEREADYVGMYILARGGRPYFSAAAFWRRMGEESPGSIRFASTHPTTAERFLQLDKTADEVDEKKKDSRALLPDFRKK